MQEIINEIAEKVSREIDRASFATRELWGVREIKNNGNNIVVVIAPLGVRLRGDKIFVCSNCGRSDQKHGGKGRCIRCYHYWKRTGKDWSVNSNMMKYGGNTNKFRCKYCFELIDSGVKVIPSGHKNLELFEQAKIKHEEECKKRL